MKRLILLILIVPAATFLAWMWSAQRSVSSSQETVFFAVSTGDGAVSVAERLEDAGLIRSAAWFKIIVWRRGTAGDFKPGSFELTPSMEPGEIERALTRGTPITNERTITVIEGWTLNDIADYLEKKGVVSKAEFHAEAGASADLSGGLPDWSGFSALAGLPKNASLEGYLFPDTYRIFVDADAKAIVRRMLANFETKLTPDLRAEIAAKGRTIHEIVIMASVIEREVRGDEDMAMVSDIFWKRVDAGRGLEADSTVNYCTGKSLASVTYADTGVDCAWNTYKWRGLPAGPIGNPGIAAILAAIRPTTNPYWYFLTDAEGTVYYGRTLDEHNANKRKYLN